MGDKTPFPRVLLNFFHYLKLIGQISVVIDTATGWLTNVAANIKGVIGAFFGAAVTALAMGHLPPIVPAGYVSINDPGHAHTYSTAGQGANANGSLGGPFLHTPTVFPTNPSFTGITAAFQGIQTGGNSSPFNVVQPSIVVNYIIRLG